MYGNEVFEIHITFYGCIALIEEPVAENASMSLVELATCSFGQRKEPLSSDHRPSFGSCSTSVESCSADSCSSDIGARNSMNTSHGSNGLVLSTANNRGGTSIFQE